MFGATQQHSQRGTRCCWKPIESGATTTMFRDRICANQISAVLLWNDNTLLSNCIIEDDLPKCINIKVTWINILTLTGTQLIHNIIHIIDFLSAVHAIKRYECVNGLKKGNDFFVKVCYIISCRYIEHFYIIPQRMDGQTWHFGVFKTTGLTLTNLNCLLLCRCKDFETSHVHRG